MQRKYLTAIILGFVLTVILTPAANEIRPQKRDADKQTRPVLTGQGAMGDWTTDAPGVRRRITPADLPKPYESPSVRNGPKLVARPANAFPKVPDGFKVEEFLMGLKNPRLMRT